MKTQWKLSHFSLDLSPLWSSQLGLVPSPSIKAELSTAWKGFFSKCSNNSIGFFDWPSSPECSRTVANVQNIAGKLRECYQGALCIGIGGSYLGPAALQEIFKPVSAPDDFQVHWLSNVDSAAIKKAEAFIAQRKCAVVIISKSGGTTETLAAWFYFSHKFKSEDVVVITDPQKGELRRLARELNWKNLEVPPNIGGRFSVLTSVGLLPLALQNISVENLIDGAKTMRAALMNTAPEENPATLYAYSKFLWDKRSCSIQYLMPYDSRLRALADWYVQLWAESLGKKQIDTHIPVGPNPVAALGTSDQHSLLQLFKEGPRQRIIGFLTAGESDSPRIGYPTFDSPQYRFLSAHTFNQLNVLASEATQESLIKADIPTYRFELNDLSPTALGAFIQFQETACGVAGELYHVNAYDQPGVEDSKQILKSKLSPQLRPE